MVMSYMPMGQKVKTSGADGTYCLGLGVVAGFFRTGVDKKGFRDGGMYAWL